MRDREIERERERRGIMECATVRKFEVYEGEK